MREALGGALLVLVLLCRWHGTHSVLRVPFSLLATLVVAFDLCLYAIVRCVAPPPLSARRPMRARALSHCPGALALCVRACRLLAWVVEWISLLLEWKRERPLVEATSFAQWHEAAIALDQSDGRDAWREKDESPLYDFRHCRALVRQVRRCRRRHTHTTHARPRTLAHSTRAHTPCAGAPN